LERTIQSGRHVTLPRACATCDIEIVGVTANARYGRLKEGAAADDFPVVLASGVAARRRSHLSIANSGQPHSACRTPVRRIVERADPSVPLMRVKTQEALIEGTINQEVTFARLCMAFAVLRARDRVRRALRDDVYGVARRTKRNRDSAWRSAPNARPSSGWSCGRC